MYYTIISFFSYIHTNCTILAPNFLVQSLSYSKMLKFNFLENKYKDNSLNKITSLHVKRN